MSDDTYRWYLVLSPEHDYHEPVPGVPGPGPCYSTRDVAVVKAPDASAAKWEAARLWERHSNVRGEEWPTIMRGEGRHPLSGVTVERWEDTDESEGKPSEPNPRGWRPFYADLSEAVSA